MIVGYLSKIVVLQGKKVTQQSIPRIQNPRNRLSPPSLDQLDPDTASGAPPSCANALAPFPTRKYFLTLTQAHEDSFPSSYLSCFSNQAPWGGPGRSPSPCCTMDAAFAHQDPHNFLLSAVMVVITDFFLESCGLAHSRHGARTPKSEGLTPSPLGLATAVILGCNFFFINVLSLAKELEKIACSDLDGVATVT